MLGQSLNKFALIKLDMELGLMTQGSKVSERWKTSEAADFSFVNLL